MGVIRRIEKKSMIPHIKRVSLQRVAIFSDKFFFLPLQAGSF